MGSSPTANRAAALCPTKVTSGRSPTSPSTSAPPTPRNLDYRRSPRILPRPGRFSLVVEQRFRKPQVSSSSLEIGSEVSHQDQQRKENGPCSVPSWRTEGLVDRLAGRLPVGRSRSTKP